MDLTDLWQIACGLGERDYGEVFIRHSVALIGGDLGNYVHNKKKYSGGGWKAGVRSFASQVKTGDLFVMRHGRDVRGLGRVLDEYEYDRYYSGIQGWSLPHCRPVKWKRIRPAWRPKKGFSRAPGTFSAVAHPHILKWAEENCGNIRSRLSPLRGRLKKVKLPGAFRPALSYYRERDDNDSTEADVVAHMVVTQPPETGPGGMLGFWTLEGGEDGQEATYLGAGYPEAA
ncbi:MAG: hypothetical protein O7H41_19500 [Planctomycetota bacterium]|nr:hypothetical protein [Planctomycetota bacterium]